MKHFKAKMTEVSYIWLLGATKEQAYCHLRFKGFKIAVEFINQMLKWF